MCCNPQKLRKREGWEAAVATKRRARETKEVARTRPNRKLAMGPIWYEKSVREWEARERDARGRPGEEARC
jgi:hypothetical protein